MFRCSGWVGDFCVALLVWLEGLYVSMLWLGRRFLHGIACVVGGSLVGLEMHPPRFPKKVIKFS